MNLILFFFYLIHVILVIILENSLWSAAAPSQANLHVIAYSLHKIYSHYPACYTNRDEV